MVQTGYTTCQRYFLSEDDEARTYISIDETRGQQRAQVTSIFLNTGKKPYIGGFFPNTKYIQHFPSFGNSARLLNRRMTRTGYIVAF